MNSVDFDVNSIKNTKEKEYKKYINFGKLQLKDSTLIANEFTFINEMKKNLETKFLSKNEYVLDKKYDSKLERIVERKEKLSFKKITSSNDHFFGTFSRLSRNKDVLTDIVDNESNEKIDPEKIYFEHNTLFYIDYNLQAISFIKTEHIKNVYPFLEAFINNDNLLNISIIPLVKNDKEIIDSVITELEIALATVEINPNQPFVGLNNLEKMGCKVKNYKLNVNLSSVKTSFSSNLLNFRSKNRHNIKKMSISTIDEDIDLLTNRFTKSVPIKLSNNYEDDFSTIELTLKTELLKAVQ